MTRSIATPCALAAVLLAAPAAYTETATGGEAHAAAEVGVTGAAETSESAGTEAAPAPSALAALQQTIQLLRIQLDEQERQLAQLQQQATAAIQLAAPEAVVEQAHYLPSRSWAGGRLHYGGDQARIETHGFIDLDYIDAQPDGSRGGVSTFDNHHANVFFTTRPTDRLLAHVEIEYEHAGDTVEIDQAFMSFKAADWLSFEAGRFYTPFGIERFVWYSPTNALVSRPQVHRVIVPGNFYAQGLRLSGLVEADERPLFSYEVALTDGLGENALESRRGSRQTRDNNSSRAVSGRVAAILWPRVEVGSSYHWQRYSTDGRDNLAFFGLDASGRWQGFELRAEYITARLDRATLDLDALRQNGWYTQLGYTLNWPREIFPSLTLVGRLEGLDLDEAALGNDDRRRYVLGANAALVDHLRFKLEYQWNREDGDATRDDTFLGQLVLDF